MRQIRFSHWYMPLGEWLNDVAIEVPHLHEWIEVYRYDHEGD